MTPKIRLMLQNDIDNVYDIEKSTHRAPWGRDILSDCVLVGYDCRVLELPNDDSTKIIGYIISRYSFNVCHILNLCVSFAYQGRGYGQLLLKSVLDPLSNNKAINTVILEVRPSNTAAIALYEKFGFNQVSIKKGYYNDGDRLEDAILLKKML
ncbi:MULTISPECIES: ribosomal protein S18-alanine N-acetyltransferase [Legionella]|uniref:[Ribosomal protein bS18]-alanine N-acetyltransferase n=1 Tax=Legionella drozanskii LLAP-1 TaxID=1212489 RepID=A0A0W0TBP9_9GAMM|nr:MULTISPECIES: ribosomal protein S18-alanine N-acetyltransferase [Legionella]KTC92998.1 GCN5-related N-acetyltransferase [Legionella drozanskii LLAP-1]PJE11906.1 MAG: ribosomal-protein-alanine N-acetyltransferase [Legionella sp.]